MAITLDGTNGINSSGVIVAPDGSASAPAITNDGDTNTGIFFPAADTIAFAEGGAEAMRIDSSGRVGIGTTSPATLLNVSSATTNAARLRVTGTGSTGGNYRGYEFGSSGGFSGGIFQDESTSALSFWSSSGGPSATIDSSGNVGIGITDPSSYFSSSRNLVFGSTSTNGGMTIVSNASSAGSIFFADGTAGDAAYRGYMQYNQESDFLRFGTAATERARITSGGDLLVGTTSNYGGRRLDLRGNNAGFIATLTNSNAGPAGLQLYYDQAAPNNTASEFLQCQDSGATRMTVRSNGGIANFSANNVNLSDRREKTNFAPAKNYLDTICAIPVQTFNYIDQNLEEDDGLTLGVVAQDVQEVAPELVMESNWGTEEEPKMRLSIYQTDLQYALMKCIQELKAELDQAKARIAVLENNNV